MASSLEDLERRVDVLEAHMRANDAGQIVINEKLNGLLGSSDAMLGILRDQGRLLATHSEILGQHSEILGQHSEILGQHTETLGQHTAKLDMIVAWIQNQP